MDTPNFLVNNHSPAAHQSPRVRPSFSIRTHVCNIKKTIDWISIKVYVTCVHPMEYPDACPSSCAARRLSEPGTFAASAASIRSNSAK